LNLVSSLTQTLDESQHKKLLIEIIGLGYVGFPLAIRLAVAGWKVRGIDTNPKRIQRLEENNLMDSEIHLRKEFSEARNNGNLLLSQSSQKENSSRIGIICVPTPIKTLNADSNIFVKQAIEKFLGVSKSGDIIIIESSIEVGTTEEIKKLIVSKGFKVGEDFGLCFCPERIDPQNHKWQLENIPRVIYCSDDTSFHIAQKIYHYVNNSNLIRVNSPKIAEVVKSFENTFRLVNISLVNELAILCDKLQINVHDVIRAASTKPFGFMPFYSGAGAGGHCIPKDPGFLSEASKKFGFDFKSIDEAIRINNYIPKYISNSLEQLFNNSELDKKILICGMSYKPNIEDMRDSPGFKILNELIKKKFKVTIYDPYFKDELLEKYLIENNLEGIKVNVIHDLNDESIKNFQGLCIVQHHTKTKNRLDIIYKNSLIPLIYDCQNKIEKNPTSSTILKSLGG
jgi:UDP-N-acetyl-D-glucosamine dehydrogenase